MTGYFLLDNPNHNARDRGNGHRFHGYPSRSKGVRLIVVHTSESAFDTDGPDTGAENVARYLSGTDRAASYHDIVDSDSHRRLLPWEYTAFGARGHNSHAIHVAFAGQAAKWDELTDEQVDARLQRAAEVVAAAARRHGVPVRRLVGRAARSPGGRGICGHGDLDPSRRSDPGEGFPWDRFFVLVRQAADDQTSAAAPAAAEPTAKPKTAPESSWTEDLVKNLPTLHRRADLRRASAADRRLQGLLAAAGYLDIGKNLERGRFDGRFGKSTEEAVEDFQVAHKLSVDGIVGRKTWTVLLGGKP